ncbi:MAG: hypothetical protein IT170_13530 [Bryobacterales bacterium]|nr:hypothetical protein [Bryobacterales bacterium]
MSFRTPDGALHLLRLKGQLDSMSDGFYNVGPNALKSACYQDPNPIASMLTYFTTDGSYIRVEIPADGTDWTAKQWTAYFPDGSRVQGYSSQATKIIDRNSNEVQIINGTLSNGHPGTIIKDAFNRTIEIDYDGSKQSGAYDYIRSSGYGATLESRITWGSTETIGFLYPCRPEGLYCNALISHPAIHEILLPASGSGKPRLSYTFTYSGSSTGGFGEVKSVTTPGGVTATYNWFMEGLAPWEIGPIRNPIKQRHLTYTEKRDGASTQIGETTAYSFDAQRSIITYPDGGVRSTYFIDPRVLGSWSRGLVYKVENPDGSVLQRQWLRNRPFYVPENDAGNPYVRTEILSVASGGTLAKSSAKVYSYDKNGNVLELNEYDWGTPGLIPGAPDSIAGPPSDASLKRRTVSSFFNATPAAGDGSETVSDHALAYWYGGAPRVIRATKEVRVEEGAAAKAVTQYVYDNASTTANVTQEWRWDSTKAGYSPGATLAAGNAILTSHQYDSYGNRTQTTDPNGNVSRITYDGNSLYPATRYEAFGSTVQRQFNLTHHFAAGLLTQSVDADNSVTTNYSYDYFGRPTLVQEAYGATEQRNTETDYQDDLRRVITRQGPLPGSAAKLVTVRHYDSLGRIRLTQQLEDSLTQPETSETTGIKTQTQYRFVSGGSLELASNPYRANTSAGAGGEETMGWTLTKRDLGGRVVSVKTYPGAAPPSPWGSNSSHTGDSTFSYSANATTISDQAGKARTNTVDGLGRLISVAEPGPNTTSYTYDVMDNLLSVSQAGQSRAFVYSSLSRLSSASNPESGTTYYYYDNNGNLARKVDARNVTVCFGTWNGSSCNAAVEIGYDRLNRVLRKQYSATIPETPGVTYTYDCATNGKGLPCGVANSESASNIGAYDKLGRVTARSQVTAGATYPMSYGWDIAGNPRSMTLPSARTLTRSYDNAARATGVTGTKAGESNRTYASGMSYAAHGGLAGMAMGNGLTETWGYNSRMQPRQVSAVRSGTTQLGLGFYYCGSQVHTCGDNNGNPRIETIAIPGQSWTRSFGYDGWNRVSTASEGSDYRNFGYSATGNMWVTASSAGWTPPSFTPRTSAWFDANNRLVNAGLGVQYDTAGNQTGIGGYTFTYDAEGRMTGSTLAGAATAYAYDGEGRRVKKTAAGVSTWYIYGADGQLMAEYGGPAQTAGTRYLTADHLGSVRLVTDASGNVVSRHDYLPFGEEIPAGVGGRTTGMGYVANAAVTQMFTGKERDTETGLDYFGARYLSGVQGRWTSPDQINVTKARLFNPSNTFNKYAYAANNPLKFVDPDGNDVTIYYRASRGLFTTDFGHVFIGALNQKTGQVRFLDYWAGSGPPGPGVVNQNMTLDRLREHGSITIQTTPEAAQKVIDQIDKIMANPPDYTLRLSHTGPQGLACTILCQNVLREIGIDLSGAYLPYDVWNEAYRKYSPLFSNFGQWSPGTHTWGPTPVRYQPGRDFGAPRFSGIDYNSLMWSLYINNNAAPPKACVEVSDSATGTKNKQCE